MKPTTRIADFCILKNKKTNQLDIKFYNNYFNEIKTPETKEYSFFIGYKYTHEDYDDGEYVSIHVNGEIIKINNDIYSSIPVYIYENSSYLVSSTSIYLINEMLPYNIDLDSDILYTYFAFGYIPAVSKTIYKNIRTMEPNTELVIGNKIVQRTRPKLFQKIENSKSVSKLIESFSNSVKLKCQEASAGETTFCISSGLDSLLGALSLKSQKVTTTTSTWGLKNSLDIKYARKRSEQIGIGSVHHEFFIDDLQIAYSHYKKFSKITGGISPTSSIYLMFFTDYMSNIGKTYHIYCDYLEITRRHYKTLDELRNKYITPKDVSDYYFTDKVSYDFAITNALENISNKYNNYMQTYLYDRCVNGAFYKNSIIRKFGVVKITTSLDAQFLQANYHFLNNYGYSFDFMIVEYKKMTGLSLEHDSQKKIKTNADFCFSALDLIKNNKNIFIDLINETSSEHLSTLFNFDEIKISLNKNQYVPKAEWFLHRLFNILIFKRENSIGIV